MRMLAGLLICSACLFGASARAQDASGSVLHTRVRQFKVPFNLGPGGAAQLQQLQLYVSSDHGRAWSPVASAPPDQGYFRFSTDRDGTYWFAVQTLDKNNRAFPSTMEGASPNLKVIVDTVPPAVIAQALPSRGNEVGISWSVRDESYTPNSVDAIRLDYRSLNGSANWTPLVVPPGASQLYWSPNTNGPIEVRIQARDQAGNLGDGFARVGLGNVANGNPASPAYSRDYPAPTPAPTSILHPPNPSELKLVNSKRIALNYDLKDVGPSKVSAIELWYTFDGRSWNKYGQPFGEDPNKNLTFEVEREGLYGISLVAKSGVGLGERPPQSGDRPQLWIEVDLTKPQVQVRNVLVGQGVDKGKLKVTWTASDRNLGSHPVSLRYAEQATGPWQPIVEKVANTGEYTWTMPPQVPYQFYVRVEAFDRAGNQGEDVTPQAVKVDLSIPRAVPRDVTPAN